MGEEPKRVAQAWINDLNVMNDLASIQIFKSLREKLPSRIKKEISETDGTLTKQMIKELATLSPEVLEVILDRINKADRRATSAIRHYRYFEQCKVPDIE